MKTYADVYGTFVTLPARISLRDFAASHGFALRVQRLRAQKEYAVCFHGAEVIDGGVLVSERGRGKTLDAAMQDYAKSISERCIVFHAYSDARVEIEVPKLYHPVKRR